MSKKFYISLFLFFLLSFAISIAVANAAPTIQFFRDIQPETDSKYFLGTTTPTTRAFAGGIFDQLCLTGDSCKTAWPTGSIGTSSAGVISSLLYFTTSGATPELVSPVATTSLTATSPLSLSNAISVIGSVASALSLDTSGAWTGTAGSLAANGTNCSSGSFPLGVDASGNSEGCTVATTGTVTSIATTYPITGGTITSSGTIGLAFGTTTSNTWAGTQTFTNDFIVNGTATSTFAGNVDITGNLKVAGKLFAPVTFTAGDTTITGNLNVDGTTRLATSLTGFLKATAGTIATSLISLTADITGTLAVGNGGTGTSTAAIGGQILAWVGSNWQGVATTTFSSGLTYSGGNVTADLGTSVDLTTEVTGTLPIANGGTNATSQTTNGVNYFNGTSITSGTGFTFDGTNVGIGTTSPFAKLSIDTVDVDTGFAIASSTETLLEYDTERKTLLLGGQSDLVDTGAAGVARLQAYNEGFTEIKAVSVFDSGANPSLVLYKARGSLGSETIVNDADFVGNFFARGYDGTAYRNVAGIRFGIDGTPGAGDTPGFITFNTSADGTFNFSERVRIDSSGNVGIGTTLPLDKLHVEGVIRVPAGTGNLVRKYANVEETIVSTRRTDESQEGLFRSDGRGNFTFNKSVGIGYSLGSAQTGNLLVSGNVGIGDTTPDAKLDVEGTAIITTSTAVADDRTLCTLSTTGQIELKNGACGTSSREYKENIRELSYGLGDILKLDPVLFNYKTYQEGEGRTKDRVGFIAEDIELVIPEVVIYEDGKPDGIDYAFLVVPIVNAIQELYETVTGNQEKIKELEERIERLEAKL